MSWSNPPRRGSTRRKKKKMRAHALSGRRRSVTAEVTQYKSIKLTRQIIGKLTLEIQPLWKRVRFRYGILIFVLKKRMRLPTKFRNYDISAKRGRFSIALNQSQDITYKNTAFCRIYCEMKASLYFNNLPCTSSNIRLTSVRLQPKIRDGSYPRRGSQTLLQPCIRPPGFEWRHGNHPFRQGYLETWLPCGTDREKLPVSSVYRTVAASAQKAGRNKEKVITIGLLQSMWLCLQWKYSYG